MYSTTAISQLRDALEKTPAEIFDLVADLSELVLRNKKEPGEFSVIENICHLRDIESEGYTPRIRRILEEDRPTLPDIDGGRLARERDYNSESWTRALGQFRIAREANLAVLDQSDKVQLDREGILEGVGIITLGKLLTLMREHDESHINEIRLICERTIEGDRKSRTGI